MSTSFAEHEHFSREELARLLEQLAGDLAAGQRRIEQRREYHRALHSELKSVRAEASDLSWELADLEQRMSDLKAQREGPPDPLLERELTSIAARRADLEEQVLARMLLVDEMAARIAGDEPALAADEHAWQARRAQLAEQRQRIVALLAALDSAA